MVSDEAREVVEPTKGARPGDATTKPLAAKAMEARVRKNVARRASIVCGMYETMKGSVSLRTLQATSFPTYHVEANTTTASPSSESFEIVMKWQSERTELCRTSKIQKIFAREKWRETSCKYVRQLFDGGIMPSGIFLTVTS
jgi:hypothetical protein